MKHGVIHSGQFLGLTGTVWRVDIWRLMEDQLEPVVADLTFPADEPVVIEWPEKGKEEPICGSTATVKIESPTDRAYIGLYAVTPGEIGVDIYKDGKLYWAGTLDPEQYEEPYERLNMYDVTLTFQDFGILDRLKFDRSAFVSTDQDGGLVCASDILVNALSRAQIAHLAVDIATYVSSWHPYVAATSSSSEPDYELVEITDPDTGAVSLKPLYPHGSAGGSSAGTAAIATEVATLATFGVLVSNFADDDGEPWTLRDVLEAILQPLGQRLIQRGGKVYVYDLNGLATANDLHPVIEWSSDTQTLAADRLASSVKVTYDPNGDGTLMDSEALELAAKAYPWQVSFNGTQEGLGTDESPYHGYLTLRSHLPNDDTAPDDTDASFTLHVGQGSGLAEIWDDGAYCRIIPQMGGSEAVGVLGTVKVPVNGTERLIGGNSMDTGTQLFSFLTGRANGKTKETGTVYGSSIYNYGLRVLFRTKRVYVPAGEAYANERLAYQLRLTLELMLDPRYNPFEQSGDDNYGEAYDAWKSGMAYLFIPCEVRIYDRPEGGSVVAQYTNRGAASTYRTYSPVDGHNGYDINMGWKRGRWLTAPEADGDYTATVHTWLAWYDHSGDAVASRYETTGVFGIQGNRHQIGATNGKLMADVANAPAGEYMPLPPRGGWLEVSVYDGAFGYIQVPNNKADMTIALGKTAVSVGTYGWAGALGDDIHMPCVGESGGIFGSFAFFRDFRWLLYKHPVVAVVDPSPQRDVADADEIETEAVANAAAKEPIEIDTKCGTMEHVTPCARGQLYRLPGLTVTPSSGSAYTVPIPVHRLRREGETATPERLLVRTLSAQYGTRRTSLSGEASLDDGALHVYVERNQTNRGFILASEEQDLRMGVAECRFDELVDDKGMSADIIRFADAEVKRICVENWGGHVVTGEITRGEAAAVESLGGAFRGNTEITSFDELKYFTGLTTLYMGNSAGEFYGCANLGSLGIPASLTDLTYAFRQIGVNTRYTLDLTPITAQSVIIGAAFREAYGLTTLRLPGIAYTGTMSYGFRNCSKLTAIDIDGTADLSGITTFSNCFNACTQLTDITGAITGISLDISLAPCTKLTRESALVIINGLADLTGKASKTLTLAAATKALLTTEDTDIITAKNWTLA